MISCQSFCVVAITVPSPSWCLQSTPLHLAAGYNRVGVVELLLQHGADAHAKDKGGLVPLHNACSYGHFEVTELLLKVSSSANGTQQCWHDSFL